MTRDYANKPRKPAGKKASASRKSIAPPASPPWIWFLTGLLCGIFLSGLVWLASQKPEGASSVAAAPKEPAEERPEPRFDFYTLLPEQRIDVDLDPESVATAAPSIP